jgi:hypothetical protein
MFKRTLMGAGLGLALLGGVATAVHTSGTATVHAAPVLADLKVLATAPQAADAETNVDSQSTAGPADSAAESTAPETSTEATTPDTDNVQSGDQSTAD